MKQHAKQHMQRPLSGLFLKCQPPYLVLLVERADVVLKRVGDPASLDPDVRHALQGVPGVVTRANGSVDELIKVVVVAENDVAAHIIEEALWGDVCAGKAACLVRLDET